MKSLALPAASAGLILILSASMLWTTGCTDSISGDELRASVELTDINTRWEKKYYQPWPPKLTLVPAISFKIKNVGEKPLQYVYVNGIFRLQDENKSMGDNFVAGIRGEPVLPGDTSETISLQSFHGVEGNNLAHFRNNPAWKTAIVKIFLKSKGSQYVEISEFEISKDINFTEPEPVGMDPQPKTKKKN